MLVPSKYIEIDNITRLSIQQVRNNGSLNFTIKLILNSNKHINGINIIDCLNLNASYLTAGGLFDDLPLDVQTTFPLVT
jgi:hypothetical protein